MAEVLFLKTEYEIAAALRHHAALGPYVEVVADNAEKASWSGFHIRMSERLLLRGRKTTGEWMGSKSFPSSGWLK